MQATLEQWLCANYSNDQLEEMAEDGCNWGGELTNKLYFEYYADIWLAYSADEHDTPISKFSSHAGFARYMLRNAVRYYAHKIVSEQ